MNQQRKAASPKVPTESKTLRLKTNVINGIESLANQNNRNFSNMAETLMIIGMENYPGLQLTNQ